MKIKESFDELNIFDGDIVRCWSFVSNNKWRDRYSSWNLTNSKKRKYVSENSAAAYIIPSKAIQKNGKLNILKDDIA